MHPTAACLHFLLGLACALICERLPFLTQSAVLVVHIFYKMWENSVGGMLFFESLHVGLFGSYLPRGSAMGRDSQSKIHQDQLALLAGWHAGQRILRYVAEARALKRLEEAVVANQPVVVKPRITLEVR